MVSVGLSNMSGRVFVHSCSSHVSRAAIPLSRYTIASCFDQQYNIESRSISGWHRQHHRMLTQCKSSALHIVKHTRYVSERASARASNMYMALYVHSVNTFIAQMRHGFQRTARSKSPFTDEALWKLLSGCGPSDRNERPQS